SRTSPPSPRPAPVCPAAGSAPPATTRQVRDPGASADDSSSSERVLRRELRERREMGADAGLEGVEVRELADQIAARLLGIEVEVVEAPVRIPLGHAREAARVVH